MCDVRLILLCTGLVCLSFPANAVKDKSSRLSISVLRSQYSDIKMNTSKASETPTQTNKVTGFEPTNDVEMDIRLRNYFNLALTYGKSIRGPDTTNMGGGLRVDTPGFFFLGGNPMKDVKEPHKRFPINTSIFAFLIYQLQEEEGTTTVNGYVGSNLGVAMDIFLFNHSVYSTAQASVFNMQSNAFFSYAFGLGIEF
jgi:hypothetical protein